MSTDDPKAENIMNNVYIGKEATKCDGSVFGYSKFMHILTTPPKKQTGEESYFAGFEKMITIDAQYKLDVDYTFQHRYRSKSIDFYFKKEFVFGIFIWYNSFDVWNFQYNGFFKGKENYFQ